MASGPTAVASTSVAMCGGARDRDSSTLVHPSLTTRPGAMAGLVLSAAGRCLPTTRSR